MKRLVVAAAAALLLASCETYPPGEPYGAPYPPEAPYGAPYPPEPYPPTPYPPPGPYPPAGAYPAGVCGGVASRDWRAWVADSPGSERRPTLFVTGTVLAPTAGYRFEFRPYLEERRTYPVQVVATLQPFPPTGAAAQVVTTHDVRWQWPLASGPVGSVTIRCGEGILATVSPVPDRR